MEGLRGGAGGPLAVRAQRAWRFPSGMGAASRAGGLHLGRRACGKGGWSGWRSRGCGTRELKSLSRSVRGIRTPGTTAPAGGNRERG